MIVLDLNTAIIPQNQQIWSMFPGLNRIFLPTFIERGCVFLDTPAISLSYDALYDDRLLKQHIVMSQKWSDYLRGHTKRAPSRNPLYFSIEDGRSISSAAGNIKTLFLKVKPMDLILVGQKTIYDPILIGEVVGQFNPEESIAIPRCEGELGPLRRVRWLETATERRFMPQALSKLLSNRKAVINIDKSSFGQDVFKYAYGDYVFGENARYIFSGPKYRNIATQAVPGIELITYFAAAFNACEIGELEKFAAMSIDAAINSYFEQDILYSFEIDFSSPGEYILHARRAALPLLVAALIAATAGDLSFAQAAEAHIVNTAEMTAGQSGCEIEVQQKYRAIMAAINVEQYNAACNLNKEAQDGVGLKVKVHKKHVKKVD
ncbi:MULTISPECIES: hypothetical protein [Methylosinus]|uniref:hypothetical protein n=1 Tax=Methylosinus TaxID=425 RepID=UPI0012DC17B5|nr:MULTISPECIES: hypothetical protein [Methylosinus]